MTQQNDRRFDNIILITGCARSGTSLVAGSINLCGAFGGVLAPPNRHNQRGMFENSAIRETICKPYLRELGVDPLGQYPLPDVTKLPIPADWRGRVETVLKNQGYKGGPVFYKGAKCCLVWSVWHYAFPDAKWIIVRRRTADIVRSCQRTGFMRAFRNRDAQAAVGAKDEVEGWQWWVHQHEARFREMVDAGLNIKVVWPERMVTGDYSQLMCTMEWLGLPWRSEVLQFVDPKLWKARNLTGKPADTLPSPTTENTTIVVPTSGNEEVSNE